MAPAIFADVTDYLLNVAGTSYCPAGSTLSCSNFGGLAGAGASSSLDLGTGLGTVSLTYSPGAAGNYSVVFWLFEQLSQPGFNEYGNAGGSALGNQSWQIDVPDYDYTALQDPNYGNLPAGAGTIIANTQAGKLLNNNFVPGKTDTFDFNCPGLATCNDYVSMAMGFNFTLAAGYQEVVTFNVSTTA